MKNLTTAICLIASGVLMVQGPLLAEGGGAGHAGGGGLGGGGFSGGSIGNVGHVNNPPYYPGGYVGYGYAMGPTTVEGDGDLNARGSAAAPVAGTGTGGGPPEEVEDGRGVYVPTGATDPGGPSWDSDWWAQDPRSEAEKAAAAAPAASTGAVVPSLPTTYDTVYAPNARYFVSDGVYYQEADSGYQVVTPPAGLEVKQLPHSTEMVKVGNQQYFVCNDIYYQAHYSGSGVVYRVVDDPSS